MAGLAVGGIDLQFAMWHLVTSTRGTVDAAAVCVAGVALGDIDVHFAWQAWHRGHPRLFTWHAWYFEH